jgi:hypothetical protein
MKGFEVDAIYVPKTYFNFIAKLWCSLAKLVINSFRGTSQQLFSSMY